MTTAQFDHFITAADIDNIDSYLEEYRQAGFLVAEQTVRHKPGLRNGFVRFGPEYLEFVWVEDEALFDEGADSAMFPHLRDLRAAHRPFGIGIASPDVAALREEWLGRGYKLPRITSGGARDAEPDAPPAWSFQNIPPKALPGAITFALTYHSRPKDGARKVEVAPNGTYAVEGVTFAADEPGGRAKAWRDLLAPEAPLDEEGGVHSVYEVQVGPHFARWMRPEEYQEHFGLSYKTSPHPYGEMAVIHLLASDLDLAEQKIAQARPNITRIPDKRTGADTLLITPDPRDGFTFAITERPVENWLMWRANLTDEKLELVES